MRLAGRLPTRVALIALTMLALAVRGGHLASVAPGPVFTHHLILKELDMYMFDQWARRIAEGDVLGREVYHPLTTWQLTLAPAESWRRWYGHAPVFNKAPFYAYLVGSMRTLFGQPMLPLAVLQVLASTACVPLLFLLTRRLFGRSAGLLAALLLAVYGPAVHFSVLMLREVWIGLAVLLATLQLVRLRDRPLPHRAFVAGLLAGGGLIVTEALAPMVALALTWIVWRLHEKGVLMAKIAASFVAGVLLAFAPVAARNLAVGAPIASLAVMGSAAAACFNTAGSNPYFFEIHVAAIVPVLEQSEGRFGATLLACWRTFERGLPELALLFLRKSSGLLIPYENPDNANYYYAALRDPLLGLLPGYALLLPLAIAGLGATWAWRRDLSPILPAALTQISGMMFMLPLSRYRVSFALLLMPLAGLALARAIVCLRVRRFGPLGALAACALAVAVAAALVQSRVVFAGRSEGSLLYRPPEFEAGRQFHEQQGQLDAAAREMLDLARLNPTPEVRVWALVSTARLEVLRGRPDSARRSLDAARAAAGRPHLLLTVADAYSAVLQDHAAARAVLRRAATFDAPPAVKQAVEERLRALDPAPPP